MNSDVRWKQRFDNFDHAFRLLKEVVDRGIGSLSELEQQGTIQRFEIAFELAWKTLKDYLEEQGILVIPATPRNAIKEAFAAGLLDDGQIWIDMMLHRNLLSHVYENEVSEAALRAIEDRYFAAFAALHDFFSVRIEGTA